MKKLKYKVKIKHFKIYTNIIAGGRIYGIWAFVGNIPIISQILT